MTTIDLHAAKTHLSRLVDEAAAGKEITIAKAGKPLAKLVPLERSKKTKTKAGPARWTRGYSARIRRPAPG